MIRCGDPLTGAAKRIRRLKMQLIKDGVVLFSTTFFRDYSLIFEFTLLTGLRDLCLLATPCISKANVDNRKCYLNLPVKYPFLSSSLKTFYFTLFLFIV